MGTSSPKAASISLKAVIEGLDTDARTKLAKYAELIFHYRDVARLTAIKSVDEVREVLVEESLALKPLLKAGSGDVADFGSGSGIPGIPLAIALPGIQFVLYERSARKAGFLLIAVGALGIKNVAVAQDDPLRMDPALKCPRMVSRASVSCERLGEIAAKMLVNGGEMFGFLSEAMAMGFGEGLPMGLRLIELRGYAGASRSGFVYRIKWEAAVK